MGIFRNNIDIMHQSVQRQTQQIAERIDPSKILMIWEDFVLAPQAPRPLRQAILPNCLSVTVQLGVAGFLRGAGGIGSNFFEVPILCVRDGGINPGAFIANLNGVELVPGQSISFSVIDEFQNGKMVFIDPTQLWIWVVNMPIVIGGIPSVWGSRIHIGYGVLS